MAQYTTLLQPSHDEYNIDGSEQIADDRAAYDMQAQKPFEADTLNTEIMTYRPSTANWEESNEIQVRIGCTDEHWLDLQSLRLHLDFVIKKKDGQDYTAVVKDQKTYITSNLIPMLFSKIDVELDHTKMMINNCNYGLASAMLRILNNSSKEADFLKTSEYYQSHLANPNTETYTTADTNDDIPEETEENYSWRWELIDVGLKVSVEMEIFHYFLQQPKKLPPAVKFALKFTRNKSEKIFNWHSDLDANPPIVSFLDFYVRMKRVRLDADATVQRLDSITSKNAVVDMPITRYTTQTITIPKLTYVNITPLLSGNIPRRLAIGFVRNEAVSDSGHKRFDSLYFEDLGIERLFIKYDNKVYPKEGGYTLDQNALEGRQKKMAHRKIYMEVMRTWRGTHFDSELTFDQWQTLYNLYTFDLTPNMKSYNSLNYEQMKMIGDLSLEIIFKDAPRNDYSLVMLCEYNNTLSIDMQSMTPIFDFSN